MLTVYTKPDCSYCTKAKMLLDNRGISYEEKVLGVDITRDDFVTIYPWVKTMPQIFKEDGTSIGGHSHLVEYLNDHEPSLSQLNQALNEGSKADLSPLLDEIRLDLTSQED